MTAFNDKEKATEGKYAHDRELEFKAHARAHKLLGLWVAEKMGLTGKVAEDYAAALVTLDFAKVNPQHLFDKIRHDLLAHDIHISDHDIHAEMYRLENMAKQQIMQQ